MPDYIQNFLSWYLAPWRRMNRTHFNLWLVGVTLPGILLMFTGWGNHAGNFLGPVMNIMDMSQQMDAINKDEQQQGNVADVQQRLEKFKDDSMGGVLGTASGKGGNDAGMDWSGLFNSLLMLMMIPLVRMRLRDMGKTGWTELTLTILFNVSVVGSVFSSLLGFSILPMSFLWGVINFFGYGWLGMAKSRVREEVHHKVPTKWEPRGEPPAAPPAGYTPPADSGNEAVKGPATQAERKYLNHDPED